MIPKRWHTLWDTSLIAGGLLILALTFHCYHSERSLRQGHSALSNYQADRQIESSRADLARNPEDYEAQTNLAIAEYYKGPDYYVEAMNALEKARELGATDSRLFYYAGVMYDALGLPDYAINELAKYRRHYPADYETTIRLGNLLYRQRRLDEAEVLYKQALKAWPKDPTAWMNEATLEKDKGNYPDALAALNHVRQLTGQLPEGGLFVEGEVYRLQGDEPRALDLYKQEVALHPDYLPALQALEADARKRGDWKASRALRQQISNAKTQLRAATSSSSSSSSFSNASRGNS